MCNIHIEAEIQKMPRPQDTAVWAGNEKKICFNIKTISTFFTKTIPYIFLFGGTQGISYDQIAPGI